MIKEALVKFATDIVKLVVFVTLIVATVVAIFYVGGTLALYLVEHCEYGMGIVLGIPAIAYIIGVFGKK